MRRGQAWAEYITIVAVVIIMALIVMYLAGGFPSSSQQVEERDSAAYWTSADVGITRYYINSSLSQFLVKNNRNFRINVTNITSGGSGTLVAPDGSSSVILEPAQSVLVNVVGLNCSSSLYSLQLRINYTDTAYGTKYSFQGEKPLVGHCMESSALQPGCTSDSQCGTTPCQANVCYNATYVYNYATIGSCNNVCSGGSCQSCSCTTTPTTCGTTTIYGTCPANYCNATTGYSCTYTPPSCYNTCSGGSCAPCTPPACGASTCVSCGSGQVCTGNGVCSYACQSDCTFSSSGLCNSSCSGSCSNFNPACNNNAPSTYVCSNSTGGTTPEGSPPNLYYNASCCNGAITSCGTNTISCSGSFCNGTAQNCSYTVPSASCNKNCSSGSCQSCTPACQSVCSTCSGTNSSNSGCSHPAAWCESSTTYCDADTVTPCDMTCSGGVCSNSCIPTCTSGTCSSCADGYACSDGACQPLPDITPPTFSLNSTNSTKAGTPVEHRLSWQDNVALSGYIFSFCNGSYSQTSTYNWTSSNQQSGTQQFRGSATYPVNTYSTGYLNPSNSVALTTVGWNNSGAANARGGAYATANGITQTNQTAWYGYNSNMPAPSGSNTTIRGIEVRTNASCSSSSGTNRIKVMLSNNSGSSYAGTIVTPVNSYGTTWTLTTNGSASDLWGLIWTVTNANNIRVNVTGNSSNTGRTMRLDWVGVNITYTNTTHDSEANKSWVTYTTIGGNDYNIVDTVKVNITVSSYNPAASNTTYFNNNRPDIEVGIWNGTAYVTGFLCNANNGMGSNLPNSTAWNCSITTAQSAVLNAWATASNRKVEIRGVWMDNYVLSASNIFDEVNVTGVYAYMNARNTSIPCSDANAVLTSDAWAAFTSGMCPAPYTSCWSNVTKLVTSTVGAVVKWCVSANDTSNNWNSTSCITPFNYTTS